MNKYLYFLAFALIFSACGEAGTKKELQVKEKPSVPKNIILMIGDGMGLTQFYAAYNIKKDNTNIPRCKHIGLVVTSSANELITDSAASGTAIATGTKTDNGKIGVDSDNNELVSILKLAENHGLATGLVATAAITHATPAAFIANDPNRGNYENIAYDFLATDVDVFMGGGLDHFTKRKDGLNLLDSLKARNYSVYTDVEDISAISSDKVAGLFYDEHPPRYSEGRGDFLETASMKAIDILSKSEKGFFLMIEGSQIDWGGHANSTDYVVEETLDFDNVVGKVLDFAEKNGETLVIITADHETGGFTITEGDRTSGEITGDFSTGHHTPVMVPLYAFGPGAEEFMGIYDNTDVFKKMKAEFGF